MNETLLGLLWYFPTLALFVALSVIYIARDIGIKREDAVEGLREAPGGVVLLFIVLILIKIENKVQDHFELGRDYTPLFYNLEGNALIITLQGALSHRLFIHTFSVIYLITFLGIIIVATTLMALKGDKRAFRTYVVALILNYAVLIPFYLFFNVHVTSTYPPNTEVKPLLYQSQMYLSLVMLVDRLSDCFPSGHVSITFLILLISIFETSSRRFRCLSATVFLLTIFSIIYLGIHWLIDIAGGVLLGGLTYALARRKGVRAPFERFIVRFNRWFHNAVGYIIVKDGNGHLR